MEKDLRMVRHSASSSGPVEAQGENPKSLMGSMRALAVGQSLTVEAARASYAKMLGSRLGFELGRKYSSKQDAEARTLTVTRVE